MAMKKHEGSWLEKLVSMVREKRDSGQLAKPPPAYIRWLLAHPSKANLAGHKQADPSEPAPRRRRIRIRKCLDDGPPATRKSRRRRPAPERKQWTGEPELDARALLEKTVDGLLDSGEDDPEGTLEAAQKEWEGLKPGDRRYLVTRLARELEPRWAELRAAQLSDVFRGEVRAAVRICRNLRNGSVGVGA